MSVSYRGLVHNRDLAIWYGPPSSTNMISL